MTSGIHHITAIARKVQDNVDFYTGFLGLRLVKQTGGFEDARQLHLLYGDGEGSPGSLLTFLIWEDGAGGRVGHGQASEIALAIAPASIGFWLTRALAFNLRPEGPLRVFGEPALRLRDPDGIVVKLVGSDLQPVHPWAVKDIPAEHAIARIRGATVLSETPHETAGFLQSHFGYAPGPVDAQGGALRLVSDAGDAIDVVNAHGFWEQAQGTGTIDHIAFRAPDVEHVRAAEAALRRETGTVTNLHDRKYFTSLYVREPGGVLLELATDGPGFAVDEPLAELGGTLFTPPGADSDTRLTLPQFARPGEPRIRYQDLPFIHRFHTPDDADDTTIVLLHGTGGDEADLFPLAHRIAPRARLLGVRGRSHEDGAQRWFRRTSPTTFDQADIRAEAEAFAAFIDGAGAAYGLDPARTVHLGYSNGANLLGALLSLHPRKVRRAVLLRAAAVLEETPAADLSDTAVLLVSGAHDPYGLLTPPLEAALRAGRADIDARVIDAGHALSPLDAGIAREWLTGSGI